MPVLFFAHYEILRSKIGADAQTPKHSYHVVYEWEKLAPLVLIGTYIFPEPCSCFERSDLRLSKRLEAVLEVFFISHSNSGILDKILNFGPSIVTGL